MEIRFDGKRALVTGAGKGIGRDIAVALLKCGADTVALSRTQADLDSLKAEYPGIQTVTQDLSDWDATRDTVSGLGHFDLLVNNAGTAVIEPFLEIKKEDFEATMNTNFSAAFNISQVVARGMVERGTGGAIVNISSNLSQVAKLNFSAYSSSKAALDALTRSMALELGPNKIRVNSVLPTLVMTAIVQRLTTESDRAAQISRQTIKRIAEKEDVTNAVLFLLSDKASMITGSSLPVDGGCLAN